MEFTMAKYDIYAQQHNRAGRARVLARFTSRWAKLTNLFVLRCSRNAVRNCLSRPTFLFIAG